MTFRRCGISVLGRALRLWSVPRPAVPSRRGLAVAATATSWTTGKCVVAMTFCSTAPSLRRCGFRWVKCRPSEQALVFTAFALFSMIAAL